MSKQGTQPCSVEALLVAECLLLIWWMLELLNIAENFGKQFGAVCSEKWRDEQFALKNGMFVAQNV